MHEKFPLTFRLVIRHFFDSNLDFYLAYQTLRKRIPTKFTPENVWEYATSFDEFSAQVWILSVDTACFEVFEGTLNRYKLSLHSHYLLSLHIVA